MFFGVPASLAEMREKFTTNNVLEEQVEVESILT